MRKYMVDHLVTAHQKTQEAAKLLPAKHRAKRVAKNPTNKPIKCPVSGCISFLVGLDQHRRRIHHFNKLDPEYKRYNSEAAIERMQIHEKGRSDKKERVQKERSSPTKKPVKKEDDEVKGEDLGCSSTSDDGNYAFLEELLAAPSKPKGPPPQKKRDAIDKLPVMKLFKHHLTTFKGGSRKESAAYRPHENRTTSIPGG